MTVRSTFFWWGAVVLYGALILAVSVMPGGPDWSVGHLDKVGHVCEYLLFAWLLVQAVRLGRLREREYLLFAWLYATSYGALVELIQGLVPWRSADWLDALANAAGAALGVWLGNRYPTRSQK